MLEKQRQDEEEALAKLEAEAERKKEEERAAEAARAFELQQRLDAEEVAYTYIVLCVNIYEYMLVVNWNSSCIGGDFNCICRLHI